METSKAEKRCFSDDSDIKTPEPILVRIGESNAGSSNIRIDKNKFSIGRARDNDEIILDTIISRKHCILRCEGNDEWTIKDCSSSCILLNDIVIPYGTNTRINVGDIIEFSISGKYKYMFTFDNVEEPNSKKTKMMNADTDPVLTQQATFAGHQETQKRKLQGQLQTKQKEQQELKQQLQQLLDGKESSLHNSENTTTQLLDLEKKIEIANIQEQHLLSTYSDLLEKLEQERLQFEAQLKEAQKKWEETVIVTMQENKKLEEKLKKEIETSKEVQEKCKTEMETRVKEEQARQVQLMNEKTLLEEKLKATEEALKNQEAKTDLAASSGGEPIVSTETWTAVNIKTEIDQKDLNVIDTIDLTVPSPPPCGDQNNVFNEVSGLMEEQLTCSVCSELFVRATALNCMHTFCEFCIKVWLKKSRECPVCRTTTMTMNRVLVLDNFIEKVLDNLPSEQKERREQLIAERKAQSRSKEKKLKQRKVVWL